MDDATIDEGTIEKDTVIKGKKFVSKFKYMMVTSSEKEPLQLVLGGTGINPTQTPQYMTVEEFGAGVLACTMLSSSFDCLGQLIFNAQLDCCLLETGVDEDCWIGCPDNFDPTSPN